VVHLRFAGKSVDVERAWTSREVLDVVRAAAAARKASGLGLPDGGARVVVKPNLNNDLVALTGNSTDLRVLCALLEVLVDLGCRDVTIADGPNVGIERRRIDVFKRLRVRGLEQRYGVRIADLNREPGRPVALSHASPRVAERILDADLVISVPTVKTHAEAQLSCACKNWVGITVGQDKREMHVDLPRHIADLAGRHPPGWIVVDGLVGMEGNGPGDGTPVRLGFVATADDPWLCDLVVARLVGVPWREVRYLVHGLHDGRFDQATADAIDGVETIRPIERAPQRSILAEMSEARALGWLKRLVRPVVSQPRVAEMAYRAKIIQDVYSLEDDTITRVRRNPSDCAECNTCADVCPTRLTREEIGVVTDPVRCIGCLYCWWACPKDAISVDGDLGGMRRQVERYKDAIEKL
jgi:uncharacterized protein (DUF362 family)/NAD-dependent dihydropyrimidine dehydrogenase PreA subunit